MMAFEHETATENECVNVPNRVARRLGEFANVYSRLMSVSTSPLRFHLFTLAGWINHHQQAVIEYLQEENRILKEQLAGKRPRLNDEQRRRLAVKDKALGLTSSV